MVKRSKQNWTVGSSVKVGFISGLMVLAAIPTPGDYRPDQYILRKDDRYYLFTPHNGIERIEQQEAYRLNGNTLPL